MNTLAVTGMGVVSPLGIGRFDFAKTMFEAARRADRGPRSQLETLDASKYLRVRVAEVPGFDASRYLGEKGLRSLDRLTKLLLVATRLALQDARLKTDGQWADGSPDAVGMVLSNAYGSLETITELDRVATLEAARYINPSRFPLTVSNSAAGYASIWEDLRAINVSVSDGNCGGLDAVACASMFLDQGHARSLIVGGAEAMSEALALAFDRLGPLTGSACIGEGAALFALERADEAKRRGVDVLATVAGYGTCFVPPNGGGTLVGSSAEAVERAILAALADAGVGPAEVDAVVSGLAGLRRFDEAETEAIDRTVGRNPPIAAPKLAMGETLGAGGSLGMATAIGMFHGGEAPMVRGALRSPPRTTLVTSVGYYGNASALVMRHPSQ